MNDHFLVRFKSDAVGFKYHSRPDIFFEARKEYSKGAVGGCEKHCCYKTAVNLPGGWTYIHEALLQRLTPIEMLATAAE